MAVERELLDNPEAFVVHTAVDREAAERTYQLLLKQIKTKTT
jgi:hypothetical protein